MPLLTVFSRPRRLSLAALRVCLAAGAIPLLLTGCDREITPSSQTSEAKADHGHDHDAEPGHSHDDGHAHEDEHADEDEHDHAAPAAAAPAAPPGTISIPAQVRQNLGITFATVEMRRVASTMRVPGSFEPLPRAVREYHAPLPGRVELLVHQYDKVSTGTPLYRLDSSEWRKMQQELLSAQANVLSTSATLMTAQIASRGGTAAKGVTQQRIAASEAHIENLQESIKIAEARLVQVQKLQGVAGGRLSEVNEARSQLATLKANLSQAQEDRAELDQRQLQLTTEAGSGAFGTSETVKATLLAREAEYVSAKAQRDLLFANLSAIMGRDNVATTSTATNWTLIPEITIKAVAEGTVSAVPASTGVYVETAAQVLTTLNTEKLRFRAMALQSDIQHLSEKLSGRILKPGIAGGTDQYIPVTVRAGLEADAEERTLDLVAEVNAVYPWARTGLSTDLELVLDDTEDLETAIPVEAVIQDGVDKIFFRRNPDNPDQAVRTKADLGISDGHWIVLGSGVKAGDEVVLAGVYELMLATADAPEAAGHFHADGTFHEGED